MSKEIMVSVIILNHNGKTFVGDCIDSVLRSKYQKIEVIVIDNGSTDGSHRYLKERYKSNKLVRVIAVKNNLFFTGGNNLGAKLAKGEKLLFLNNDTEADEYAITHLVKLAKRNKKYLVQPKIVCFDDPNIIDNAGGVYSLWGIGLGRGRGEADTGQYQAITKLDYAVGTTFLIDKDFFWDLGGYDEWYKYHYEDIDLSLRAKRSGGTCWYCPQSAVKHKGSLTVKRLENNELIFNIRKNRLMTVFKNFTGLERVLRVSICLFWGVGLAFSDLVRHGPKKAMVTILAYRAVANHLLKQFIEDIRLREVISAVGGNKFCLLDIGCGDGSFVRTAREGGIEAWGIDKEPRVNSSFISREDVRTFQARGQYGVITMFHVLEHIKNPEDVLGRIAASLGRAGVLALEVPVIGNLTERWLGKKYFAYDDESHCNLWTKERWEKLIRQAGYLPVRQGKTYFEFPLTVITSSFKMGLVKGLMGLVLFAPLKILTLTGFNDEIVRIYCLKEGA